ncbi:MAG TPA: hypothetical protein PK142_00215 [bacterium]|nr:hypothetical protein [bacterium]
MAVNKKNNNSDNNIEQQNFVLEEFEDDLKSIKGLESIKRESFKKPEVFKDLSELSSFFINNPNLLDFLQESVAREEELIASNKDVPENLKKLNKIINNLENKLGLDKYEILAAFEAYNDKISLEAKSEVLKSKKTIKIGNKNIPIATLIRIPAYLAGTVAVSLTTAGVAGVAGVALFRNLEKYISDRKDKKNIETKSKEIRKKLDEKKLANNIASSLYVRKLEKEEKISSENFLINKTEEERNKIISDFVEIKYPQLESEIKDQVIRKYKYQLDIEKSQIKKEEASNIKPLGAMEKINNFLTKGKTSSVESKVIRSIIISGAIITAGKVAREIPVIKNILGAYLGWNLGGLADSMINKKEVSPDFNEQIFAEKLNNIKLAYSEYSKKVFDENNSDDNSIDLFDNLLNDLDRLEETKARAILEIEKNSVKDINPGRYLFIKKNIDETNKYIHLIRARFNAVNLNDRKENILLQDKKIQEANKLKSTLFKVGGTILGALTPSMISSITENLHSVQIVEGQAEIQSDDFFSDIKNPDFFQYSSDGGGDVVGLEGVDSSSVNGETISGIDNTTSVEGNVEVGEANIENNINLDDVDVSNAEKITEIIGAPQKSIIIESGDGISKIFDGNMSSNYKVNFIDEQTGEVFEATAGSKIIHPGDEVILGGDGNVNVICKQGIIDNPKYVDNYLPEENIVPEKMATLKPEDLKISPEINSDNNVASNLNTSAPDELSGPSIINNEEEEIVFEKPEYEMTRSSDGKLTIEKIADNNVSNSDIINDQNISENAETVTFDNSGNMESISDPNALRLDYDESGKIVLRGSDGNIITGSSPEKVIDSNVDNFEGGNDNSSKDIKASEINESSVEVSSEGFGNINESFKTPDNFKEVLGEDFSNLKIIEKVDNLGNRLGFSLRDAETGKSVDISFPRAGGIRIEEGLNDQSFGNLQENFDKVAMEDKALIIGSNNSGAFSIEDFRSGLKNILE